MVLRGPSGTEIRLDPLRTPRNSGAGTTVRRLRWPHVHDGGTRWPGRSSAVDDDAMVISLGGVLNSIPRFIPPRSNVLRLSGRRPPPFGRDAPSARRSAPTA